MRVGIDTSTLRVRHAGIAVYTLELVAALLEEAAPGESLVSFDGLHFTPIAKGWPERMRALNDARAERPSPGLLEPARLLEGVMRGGPARRRLARLLKETRFALGGGQFDVFHAVVTLPPGRTRKPVIPLVHDVSIQRFPATHPPERVRAFERWLPRILGAPVINTVSAFSREEIVRVLGVPRERIVVTHPGVDPFFFARGEPGEEAAALAPYELGDRRVILLVGTREPRKNLAVAIAAFAALPPAERGDAVLLVAGGSGWGSLDLPPSAEALMQAGALRFAGYVARGALRALYRRAALLVFPSIYEGFGIPAAEALACGTAVAVSAGTSLEEVAGPHGTRVRSDDVEGWRAAMRQALQAPPATAAERGSRQDWARRFDWHKGARRSLAMYRAVHAGETLPGWLLEEM